MDSIPETDEPERLSELLDLDDRIQKADLRGYVGMGLTSLKEWVEEQRDDEDAYLALVLKVKEVCYPDEKNLLIAKNLVDVWLG